MINNNIVSGISLSNNDKFFCDSCQYGKQHHMPFKPKEKIRKVKISEFIYIDVCGPMSERSIGGSRYFLLFKDDKSSFRHTYFLKYKSEVINKFKEFEQLLGVQLCFRRLPIDGISGK